MKLEFGMDIQPRSGDFIRNWAKLHLHRCPECRGALKEGADRAANRFYAHFLYETYPHLFPRDSMILIIYAPTPFPTFWRRVQEAIPKPRERP